MDKTKNINQKAIAEERRSLIDEYIRDQFNFVRGELEESKSENIDEAWSTIHSYDGADYAKDCYVDAVIESAVVNIFDELLSEFSTAVYYIEDFIKKKSDQNYLPGHCMDCNKEIKEENTVICPKCGRIICFKCATCCDKCEELVCKFCVLFKFKGRTRCVDCYEDILDKPDYWIDNDWINEYCDEDI